MEELKKWRDALRDALACANRLVRVNGGRWRPDRPESIPPGCDASRERERERERELL